MGTFFSLIVIGPNRQGLNLDLSGLTITKTILPSKASLEFLTNSTWAHGPLTLTKVFFFPSLNIIAVCQQRTYCQNLLQTLANEVTIQMLSGIITFCKNNCRLERSQHLICYLDSIKLTFPTYFLWKGYNSFGLEGEMNLNHVVPLSGAQAYHLVGGKVSVDVVGCGRLG